MFGLVGLCDGGDAQGWTTPDYALELKEVFVRAAIRLAEEEGVVRAMSLAGIGYHKGCTPGLEGLPSWVGDWSQRRMLPLSDPEEIVPYAAGGAGRVSDRCPRRIGLSLFIPGHTFDEVVILGPVLKLPADAVKPGKGPEGLRLLCTQLLRSWLLVSLTVSGRFGGEYPFSTPPVSAYDAFWRVMVGDRDENRQPAPQAVGNACEAWLRYVMDLAGSPAADEGPSDQDRSIHPDLFQNFLDGMLYSKLIKFINVGRRVGVTKKGFLGLFSPLTEEGDVVCVVDGAPALFTLRPVEPKSPHGQQFQLVGENFLLGAMDDEALPSAGAGLWSCLGIV